MIGFQTIDDFTVKMNSIEIKAVIFQTWLGGFPPKPPIGGREARPPNPLRKGVLHGMPKPLRFAGVRIRPLPCKRPNSCHYPVINLIVPFNFKWNGTEINPNLSQRRAGSASKPRQSEAAERIPCEVSLPRGVWGDGLLVSPVGGFGGRRASKQRYRFNQRTKRP